MESLWQQILMILKINYFRDKLIFGFRIGKIWLVFGRLILVASFNGLSCCRRQPHDGKTFDRESRTQFRPGVFFVATMLKASP